MGKKTKTLKIKQYKVPEEKFLVIVNPWGIYGNFDDADFNHIGAWFEIMLQDENQDKPSRIKAIYYQRTHRNIIVELPKEVKDVEPFLGAHLHSNFFLNAERCDDVAWIYEYKYATFGDPSSKTFAVNHPMYDKIHAKFPMKKQYPLPSPAPPPPTDVPYARAIPPEVNERIANRLRGRTLATEPQAGPSMISHSPSPDMSRQLNSPPVLPGDRKGKAKEMISLPSPEPDNRFTAYVRPAYLNSMVMEKSKDLASVDSSAPHLKMDPYDEEEAAKSMLKTSDNDGYAQEFLASIINGVKTEDAGSTYKPSADLLDALGSLPEGVIEPIVGFKAKETEECPQNIKLEPGGSTDSNYQPSGDLLAALATLHDSMDASSLWEKPGVSRKGESPNKRHIEDVLCGIKPESPKRIKRETNL